MDPPGVSARRRGDAVERRVPRAPPPQLRVGPLALHLFRALGQHERDLIRERTRAGLAAAAARGRKGGRKPVVTADTMARARALMNRGLTVREAAARLRIGKTALYEALRAVASARAEADVTNGP